MNHTSPLHDLSPSDDVPPHKRKNDGSGGAQQRAKRTRYISIACNECKRRKIKCNGEQPCQRCGNMSLECVYAPNCCNALKDSQEYKEMEANIAHLQDQVNILFDNLNALRHHVDTSVGPMEASPYAQSSYPQPPPISEPSPTHKRSRSLSRHTTFQGPTSAAYNIGVAKSSLQTMGITASEDPLEEAMSPREQSPANSPQISSQLLPKSALHTSKDQIWAIPRAEAVRLCQVWESEIGIMYPVVEVDHVIRHANSLYSFLEAVVRGGFVQLGMPGSDSIHDDQTIILKLILATALTLEGGGKSDTGNRVFEQASASVNEQMSKPPNILGIQILCLSAMYQFNRDAESHAWRIVGICARMCMEMGLHRHETYDTLFSTSHERAAAVKLFWAIYVMDRRWSFGTGMPFALQDGDIDTELPMPDESTPYLTAMIAYSKIGSKVWSGVASARNGQPNIKVEELEYLDFQVIEWVRQIPASLQFSHPVNGQQDIDPLNRSIYRLRLLLYLRANQMRILIYRPVLQTPNCIMDNLRQANTVVDIAKDTIRILTHMNRTTDFYRTHQILFNYFLISALAVLFLAVSHAPAQFSESCRDEFYQALDLVRGLSATSYVSKRLWKTIKSLKEVGPKLGLNLQQQQHQQQQQPSAVDAHSSAAVAMAGLAGHQVDELIFANGAGPAYTPNSNPQPTHQAAPGAFHETPNGMANDLTSLFEAAGHFSNIMPNGFGLQSQPAHSGASGGDLSATEAEAGQVLFGHEEELARILKDLF